MSRNLRRWTRDLAAAAVLSLVVASASQAAPAEIASPRTYAFPVSPARSARLVPEPGTALLLGSGLIGLVASGREREDRSSGRAPGRA